MVKKRVKSIAGAFVLTAAMGAGILVQPLTVHAGTSASMVWDDFSNGFTVGNYGGATNKWYYEQVANYVGNDGVPTTSANGLEVLSSGVNPKTGQPMFTKTASQNDPTQAPGDIDHVKWLAFMNHTSSYGYPGFDTPSTGSISFETWIGGQIYGVTNNPFGSLVKNANTDLRLGAYAMNTIDNETGMVFDFFVTNKMIYAFYERLPFWRGTLGNYASFSFAIPVAATKPDEMHDLKISYNKTAGAVTWFVDGQQVYQVNKIGYYIDRKYLLIDRGGTEQLVAPRQLDGGMGTFTLLDGALPNQEGLVQLTGGSGYYFDTQLGEPIAQQFFDAQSLTSNRLWGQGAELEDQKYVVSYQN